MANSQKNTQNWLGTLCTPQVSIIQRYFPTNALQTADAQTFMRSTTERHTGERGFLSLVQGLSAQVKHNLEQQKKATKLITNTHSFCTRKAASRWEEAVKPFNKKLQCTHKSNLGYISNLNTILLPESLALQTFPPAIKAQVESLTVPQGHNNI